MLGDIYTEYKAQLESQSIAYEGMLYRQVIEQLDVEALPYHTYVFVGFNVLNKVEHTLFKKLNEAGKALFYWDYDTFYLNKRLTKPENLSAVTCGISRRNCQYPASTT